MMPKLNLTKMPFFEKYMNGIIEVRKKKKSKELKFTSFFYFPYFLTPGDVLVTLAVRSLKTFFLEYS